jgi:hypothetical protein
MLGQIQVRQLQLRVRKALAALRRAEAAALREMHGRTGQAGYQDQAADHPRIGRMLHLGRVTAR